MGASIELQNLRTASGEPLADVAVEARPLMATTIRAERALRAIDEIPLVAIAAAFASGTTTIAGVGELRSKESDRIAAIERLLAAVGVGSSYERGILRITGGAPAAQGAAVETQDDHRIAMAAAALGCAAGPLAIDSGQSIEVSFPGFLAALEGLRAC
jgi:3-phosphoshikimate 1-carboxyvinyltransferase